MAVEKQIAIIYLGTQGLLSNVPVKNVKAFEEAFLNVLDAHHKDVLEDFRKGNLSDASIATIKKVAKDTEVAYTEKK